MKLGPPDQTLYLIDISSFIFRAFFAIRALTNSRGEPTNAVYGVATMLARLVEEAKPQFLAVVYDSKEPSFRKEIFTDYKANRSAPPDDLVPQFDKIEELIRCFGVPSFREPGVEADDIIAVLTEKWRSDDPDHEVVIVSGDKDLMQLVNGKVCMWDTMKNRVFRTPEVEEKFGVRPDQIRDFLAMVGDSSDNIPGVPSIGPKGASQLLNEFGDLGAVLDAAAAGKIKGKKGEVLKTHRKEAELSAELATLKVDVPVEFKKKDLIFNFGMNPETEALLRDLEFHTLVERWSRAPSLSSSDPGGGAAALESSKEFRLLTDQAEFQSLLERIIKKGEFAVDLETTSLNPREAKIVGWALSEDPQCGYYIPVGHREGKQLDSGWVFDALKPILENSKIKKIGQNLKYDWSVLYQHGLVMDGIGGDTMVADYVLDPTTRHGLDLLASKYLQHQTIKFEEVCGKGKKQIGFDEVPLEVAARYAAEDAVVTLRLWEIMKKLLNERGLMSVYATVELPLVTVLARMECEGVCIDTKWLATLGKRFQKEIDAIEEKIQAFSSAEEPLNLKSTKQLQKLLFEDLGLPPQGKTKTGYSTDAKVLEVLAAEHEVPKLLMEYREITKLKGTYVDPLPEMVDAQTGKIHAGFHQTVAATGRLSSSDPNLQNIPIRSERGQLIRKAFIPSPGNVLLACDYSQVELRILAHMSEDPDLLDAFQRGEDVHRRTAAEIYKIPPDQVTSEQRSVAKAINFGLMYGKTVFGLSQELRIPRPEAKDMIERYFKRYAAVKDLLDRLIDDAKELGYTETLLGRRRELPELNSKNPMIRNMGERMAMNTPIQGTAADLIKLAMIELDERLRGEGFRSRMMIQVHDELVLDCPPDEADRVQALVTEVMENAMEFRVPMKVHAVQGSNWQELK